MTCLRYAPRPLSLLAAITLLTACPGSDGDDAGDGAEDTEDTEDTGEAQVCVDPGSELLANAKPARVPLPGASVFTCTNGWGTDAPQKDSKWTRQVGEAIGEFGFAPVALAAHPDGGVVVAANAVFARYDADGEPIWEAEQATTMQSQTYVVAEPAGTIVLATYDWNTDDIDVVRYDANGTEIGPIAIPWNSPYPNIWGLRTFGQDLVIGGFDEDASGSYEQTLLRLDPAGEVVLRKSTNQANGQVLAVNDAGTAVFGSFPGFLVSLDNGAVLGNLSPSAGGPNMIVGAGDDFYMAGNAAGDLTVGRYAGSGSEQWLQTYDRATVNDQGRAIAAGGGEIVVVGMTNLLDSSNSYWFGTQPIVIGVDADGNAVWSDRISAHGDASAVAIGSAGEVYVAGIAESDGPTTDQPSLLQWLRRY
ncbi:hypothetical protein DB30_01724 [Enhygromyxa salina]|uniref:Beta-propeller repeat protein n=1 Tax=Enhygromyxa salina TaxID=215803 RepID=A0A0C2D9F9_9BACT|nr:hypothetical protein [Enhygromyxa salina]KIG18220.1 hypothetical protein DB30_01724 [Enhygromyxa salina]